jgi:hypothetical protein
VALAAPPKATVAPEVALAGLRVPEMLKVCTVAMKLTLVFEAPLIAKLWLLGLKLIPPLLGVTV